MDEKNEAGFNDLLGAMFGDDYQTDSDTDTEKVETTQDENTEEVSQEAEDETASGEDSNDEHTSESEEPGAEDTDKADGGDQKPGSDASRMFTIKVNKKEEKITAEQATNLSQQMRALEEMGLDFSKAKELNQQNQQLRQENTELQGRLDGMTEHQEALDILGLLADKTSTPINALAKTL